MITKIKVDFLNADLNFQNLVLSRKPTPICKNKSKKIKCKLEKERFECYY